MAARISAESFENTMELEVLRWVLSGSLLMRFFGGCCVHCAARLSYLARAA